MLAQPFVFLLPQGSCVLVLSPPPPVQTSLFLALLSLDKVSLFLISAGVQKGHSSMSVLLASGPPTSSLVMGRGGRGSPMLL